MNWKQNLKKQLMLMATDYLKYTIFNYIPDKIDIDLKPMKNYITAQDSKPEINQMVTVSGGIFTRKQVLQFEDPKYNYPQY